VAKDDRVREIRNAVESIIARLDSLLKSKLLTLMGQRSNLSQEAEHIEAAIQELQSSLENHGRSQLITKTPDLCRFVEICQ